MIHARENGTLNGWLRTGKGLIIGDGMENKIDMIDDLHLATRSSSSFFLMA
jgi:hypothetical protein